MIVMTMDMLEEDLIKMDIEVIIMNFDGHYDRNNNYNEPPNRYPVTQNNGFDHNHH